MELETKRRRINVASASKLLTGGFKPSSWSTSVGSSTHKNSLDDMKERMVTYLSLTTCKEIIDVMTHVTKFEQEGRDVLAQHKYQQAFPWWNKNLSWTTEASRAFAVVKMHHLDLAERLAENEWSCLFPNMVANEKTKRVLSPASSEDNPHETLRLVYREMQATSPVVPSKKFTVLRSCTQIDQGTWLIAEISHVPSPNTYRRLLFGCLIQRVSEAESKVS
ncbi:homeobox-leucine zipper protein ROC8 [Tanacetum coccineum]